MIKRALISFAAAATALLAGPAAHAATFALEYEASILNVVTLGRMELRGSLGPTRYQVSSSMQTSGLAQLFDDTRISARSSGYVAGSGALGWSRYDLSHAYARKARRIGMRRGGGVVSADIAPRFSDMGEPPASEQQKAASFDPLTGLVALGTAVGESGACGARVRIFDGRQHYALSLSPKARGNYRGGGYTGPAIVCTLRYEPIAGFKMTAAERSKIPRGEIWFAGTPTEGFAAPLRIAVPTPVGEGRIDIKSYSVSSAS